MTMWKTISGIVVSVCLASNHAMASDATWFCSGVSKYGGKPWLYKYVVKGRELIDLEVEWNRLLDEPGPDQPKGTDRGQLTIENADATTRYEIVEDSNIGLIAVHPITDTKNPSHPTVIARVIVINKTSGVLVTGYLTTDNSSYDEGTCQVGK
jgi:hypothetical protein